MHHILYIALTFGVGLLTTVAVLAYRKHLSIKQEAEALIYSLTFPGTQLDADLLAKVHALENGGHLASGTMQALVNAQQAAPVSVPA